MKLTDVAGRPKRRAKEDASWAADQVRALMAAPPESTGTKDLVPEQQGAERAAAALATLARADREFLEGWWREQMLHVERVVRERAEMLSQATSHPSALFAHQAMQFGAMGIPRDVTARLLGLGDGDLELYYGHEYGLGAAQVMGQVAQNLVRMATSTNDRVAVKAAVEFLNRRGGDDWAPAAQKIEVNNAEPKGNLIDSSKLTFEERQALRAIITRVTTRAALPAPEREM